MSEKTLRKALLCIADSRTGENAFSLKSLRFCLNVSKPRVSVIIDDLEEGGYVERKGHRECLILPKGKQEMDKLLVQRNRLLARFEEQLRLSGKEARSLSNLVLTEGTSYLQEALL